LFNSKLHGQKLGFNTSLIGCYSGKYTYSCVMFISFEQPINFSTYDPW